MSHPGGIPVAVLDANVLYSQLVRDVLLRLAAANVFLPRWSDRILEEWTSNLVENRPDLSPARIAGTRRLVETTFPAGRVAGFELLESTFQGVDPGDRHVAAAALQARATHLVTLNLRHFAASG